MIILTGSTGKLGSKLLQQLHVGIVDKEILTPPRSQMDLLDPANVYPYFYRVNQMMQTAKHRNVKVIHCAAMIGAKDCEENKVRAYNTNVLSTRAIASACNEFNWDMYYISTDYVFDGKMGNYSELSCPNPLTYYSLTKLLGEESVLSFEHTVIRLSHFPDSCDYESAYADKLTSALRTSDMAYLLQTTLVKMIQNDFTGILHVGGNPVSFYELARISNPNVKKSQAPEGTPMDTSFNLDKLNFLLKA